MYIIADCISTLIPLLEVPQNNNISWATVAIVVLPCLITGFITYLIHISNKRSEERKHQKSLIVTTAFEHWKLAYQGWITKGGTLPPFSVYLANMMQLFEIISKDKIDKEILDNLLEEIDKINKEAN